MKHTAKEFLEEAKSIHGDDYTYFLINLLVENFPMDYNEKIPITCCTHGTFWQTPYNHLSGHGCPHCKKNSSFEERFEKLLIKHNIHFVKQKIFNDLIGEKKHLRFDFYIPYLNICIELNGSQHYKYIEHIQKDESVFIKQQKRDKQKQEYCEKNNIKLIIIKNSEFNKIAHNIVSDIAKQIPNDAKNYNQSLSKQSIKDKMLNIIKSEFGSNTNISESVKIIETELNNIIKEQKHYYTTMNLKKEIISCYKTMLSYINENTIYYTNNDKTKKCRENTKAKITKELKQNICCLESNDTKKLYKQISIFYTKYHNYFFYNNFMNYYIYAILTITRHLHQNMIEKILY